MNKSLSEYQRYLSRVKPWVAVAVVAGVIVFGYVISVVNGYSTGTEEVASLTAKIDGLSAKTQQSPPGHSRVRPTRPHSWLSRPSNSGCLAQR